MKEAVTDRFGRPMRDLRISVTDRCQFRCSYCMPKEIFGTDYAFLPKKELLSFDELEKVVKIFAEKGVKKVRITGGEPLMRPGLPELVRRIYAIDGIGDIGLTTNGVLLGHYAKELFEAGLTRVNVSLDAIDEELFRKMNGQGVPPEKVFRGIETALAFGFQVKVNMVVQRGVNEQEILPLARYCKEKGITLRFIEFMDVGNDNAWSYERVIPKTEILNILSEKYELAPVERDYFGEVARRYKYGDSQEQVGFITSVSESFCSSCTRIRLSSDGKLFNCLFASEGRDLKQLLRGGASDQELRDFITGNWRDRDDRYSDERWEQRKSGKKKINMSYIGG